MLGVLLPLVYSLTKVMNLLKVLQFLQYESYFNIPEPLFCKPHWRANKMNSSEQFSIFLICLTNLLTYTLIFSVGSCFMFKRDSTVTRSTLMWLYLFRNSYGKSSKHLIEHNESFLHHSQASPIKYVKKNEIMPRP
jgi:hypothetical protein